MFGGNFKGFFGGGDEEDFSQSDSMPTQDEKIDNETFYKILGVDKKADSNAIKKAYRVACVKGEYKHPDKGGDPEKFKLLNEAYDCL
jgi:DnaJ homolog subfamily A member 2